MSTANHIGVNSRSGDADTRQRRVSKWNASPPANAGSCPHARALEKICPANMYLRTNAPQPGRPMDLDAMKASGFRNAGILVVNLNDQRLNHMDVERLKAIGTKLYGPKAS
ncbi:hypothetical protein [Tardiphaga sp.]|jgi:hypothetical protein|uniref:hypothetical protein n=1 Tax=Tardiphaga sp. TaxID=1926292 RepID=UPI0037DA1FCE